MKTKESEEELNGIISQINESNNINLYMKKQIVSKINDVLYQNVQQLNIIFVIYLIFLMNTIYKYFYNDIEKVNDKYIIDKYKHKSGTLGEIFFKSFVKKYFENKVIYEQYKYNNFKFDFCSNYTIYEIKNYMFESSGTADEKLLYSCYKYIDCLTKYKNIFIILLAKFENIFITKYLKFFYEHNFIDDLLDNGIYILFSVAS